MCQNEILVAEIGVNKSENEPSIKSVVSSGFKACYPEWSHGTRDAPGHCNAAAPGDECRSVPCRTFPPGPCEAASHSPCALRLEKMPTAAAEMNPLCSRNNGGLVPRLSQDVAPTKALDEIYIIRTIDKYQIRK